MGGRGAGGHAFAKCVAKWGCAGSGGSSLVMNERGVAKRLDFNELDVPEWAELVLNT
jgi:hypothetical protein